MTKNKQEYYRIPDAEDLAHIRALAAEHNADLTQWCRWRRRHDAFVRVSMAACFLALFALGVDTAYAIPPRYTRIDTCGISKEHTCDTIDLFVKHI